MLKLLQLIIMMMMMMMTMMIVMKMMKVIKRKGSMGERECDRIYNSKGLGSEVNPNHHLVFKTTTASSSILETASMG